MIVPLTSCLTGLDSSVLQIKTKIVSCHTADSKPVKQEANSTMILPLLVFPASPNHPNKNGLGTIPLTIDSEQDLDDLPTTLSVHWGIF